MEFSLRWSATETIAVADCLLLHNSNVQQQFFGMLGLLLACVPAVDFGGPQRAVRAVAIAAVLRQPIFEACVDKLRSIALATVYEPPEPRSALGAISAFGQRSSGQAEESLLPSATVDDAVLHMGEHMDSVSPLARVGRAVLDRGLRAAVQYVAGFRTTPDELGADRRRRMDIVNRGGGSSLKKLRVVTGH